MEILQTAITAEGSVSKLAQAIGTRPNVISNWHTRGVPKGWAKLLEHKYARRRKPAASPASIGSATTETVAG